MRAGFTPIGQQAAELAETPSTEFYSVFKQNTIDRNPKAIDRFFNQSGIRRFSN